MDTLKEFQKMMAEQTDLAGINDIKKALNVTLGQAFKGTSKIITNDDGLQYLDTLKDNDAKYLLHKLHEPSHIPFPMSELPRDSSHADSSGVHRPAAFHLPGFW